MAKPEKEPEQHVAREMPVISPDKYLAEVAENGITVAEKTAFLIAYYNTGNQTLAASQIKRSRKGLTLSMTKDLAFASDFLAVKNAMRHNLEQTMYLNGLKEKGYMDRITWLRTNFPKDYNPNYVDKDNNPTDAIKELSSKLDQYEIIPKAKILNIEENSSDQDVKER